MLSAAKKLQNVNFAEQNKLFQPEMTKRKQIFSTGQTGSELPANLTRRQASMRALRRNFPMTPKAIGVFAFVNSVSNMWTIRKRQEKFRPVTEHHLKVFLMMKITSQQSKSLM